VTTGFHTKKFSNTLRHLSTLAADKMV